MSRIVGFFWQMCLFRAGPESLPSSTFAILFVLAVYLPISLTVSLFARPDVSFMISLSTVLTGVSLQALVTWLVLQFKGRANRFRATWSALLGTNAFMLIILLPLSFIMINAENPTLRVFADSLWWVCFGWWLAIAGHIYHRAVEISILQGSAIAFLIELLGVLVAYNLIPR